MIDLRLTTSPAGSDAITAGYACPCGCSPATTYRRGDEVATEGCCCGNQFAVGPSASTHIHAAPGYEIRTDRFMTPWGLQVGAMWAIGPSTHDGPAADAAEDHDNDHGASDRVHGAKTAVDPVCGMTIDLETAAAKGLQARHADVDYFFCGKGCELEFGDDPGGRVPADGVIAEGSADVDESMITGESRPIAKAPGAKVIAGTIAAGGSLRIRVAAVGEETALSGIMRLVAAAQASASRAQALADRAAAILFYVALVSGIATLAFWWLQGDREGALVRTATVLVIACPHALGLAIPLVIAISTSLGARNGLLVKNRIALERARELQVVIFDKTGTLTKGTPGLVEILATDGDESALLRLAATIEATSEHPVARAIVEGARRRGADPGRATDFEAIAGRGVRAKVDGRPAAIGGPHLLAEMGLTALSDTQAWAKDGKTVLHVVLDGKIVGAIGVEDEVRPESAEAVAALHDLGLRVAMITGDSQAVADSVARRLAIDEVAAEVLPADKAAAVKRFQAGGRKVAMVGDGVNDAPALATADVGIAIGAGTDVAVESAGIVLVRSDPRDVVGAIELSRATYLKMIQNLVWATGYNLIAIPVAAGVLVPWGIDLPMAVGAVAMSVSTIIVAANAQLLRGVRLRAPVLGMVSPTAA